MTIYVGDMSGTVGREKRLYTDIRVEQNCPECGVLSAHEFEHDYISYGELKEIVFYCYDGCEHEWEVPARIVSSTITIEVDEA